MILVLVISLLVAIQLLIKSAMERDNSWWKLVITRAAMQCGLSAAAIVGKRVLSTANRRLVRCTFSLASHRWIYFCQAVLTFVFVASTVEAAHRVPSSTLATVFHLMPIAVIAVDVANAR